MDFATMIANTNDPATGLSQLRNLFQQEFGYDKFVTVHTVQVVPMVTISKITRQPENSFIVLVTIQSPNIIIAKSDLDKKAKTIN